MPVILGIDPGSRRVGVALSNPDGTIALPIAVIDREGYLEKLQTIARERSVAKVVVGLPKSLDSKERAPAEAARAMADEIGAYLGLPIELFDERLTTVAAHRAMRQGGAGHRKDKTKVDQVAATLMLQSYLDSHRPAVPIMDRD